MTIIEYESSKCWVNNTFVAFATNELPHTRYIYAKLTLDQKEKHIRHLCNE